MSIAKVAKTVFDKHLTITEAINQLDRKRPEFRLSQISDIRYLNHKDRNNN